MAHMAKRKIWIASVHCVDACQIVDATIAANVIVLQIVNVVIV
jgi:hypothetical protein